MNIAGKQHVSLPFSFCSVHNCDLARLASRAGRNTPTFHTAPQRLNLAYSEKVIKSFIEVLMDGDEAALNFRHIVREL